jgi:hypothetical protein
MSKPSLTGSWSGAYRYPGDAFPETVFNAQIEERDGAFIGTTQEPNRADSWLKLDVLTAEIEGTRSGLALTFTKFYTGDAQLGFAIRYEGEANDTLTRVDGVWTNPDWSGTFFMTRDDTDAEDAVEREAEAPVQQR